MGIFTLIIDWIRINPLKAVVFAAAIWYAWKKR